MYCESKTPKDETEAILNFIDRGEGIPLIFIHGWPLSHRTWEPQIGYFVEKGYRCIAYDRRGFGDSDQPPENFDFTTLAHDLENLLVHLDLQDVTLIGFSMGGGEVVRYLTEFGDKRISKVVLMSSIIPLVAEKPDNPAGVPQEQLEGILGALKNDRISFLPDFLKNFYNYDQQKEKVSQAILDYHLSIAAYASPHATIECAEAWAGTDFRAELDNVTVPTLIIHGDADRIVPIETSGEQAAKGIKGSTYLVIEQGPHGLNLTHRDAVNEAVLDFIE